MAKLSLQAKPTFTHAIAVPVAGGEPVTVRLTYKHRTKSELDAFIASREGVSDLDTFMDMVEGWDLDDNPFTRDAAHQLLENYIGTALLAYRSYIDELVKAKAKN